MTENDPAAAHLDILRSRLLDAIRTFGYERREEPFRLSSGGMSNDYVDMRRAVATGDVLELAARSVFSATKAVGIEFDLIGGMTMGADPVAHAVALLYGRTWFSVRKAEKTHGTGRRIEGGELHTGSRVLVFEDTVSTGRSILDAVEVIGETGASIVGACTLLDRGDELAPVFHDLDIGYVPILSYHDLSIEPISAGNGASNSASEPPSR